MTKSILKISIFALIASVFFAPIAFSQTLAKKIEALITEELPHASVAVAAKEADTGKILYSRNANLLLAPASGTKLFTALAALYQLGPNYTFTTSLAKQEGNFYLRFSGSPSLTVDDLKALLLNLKKEVNKTLSGNIVLDGSHFKPPYYPGGFSYDDLGWYYAAPNTALVLNENAVAYEAITAELGTVVRLRSKTPGFNLRLINQIITVSKEEAKEHCSLNIEILPQNTLRLFGCLVQHKEAKELKFSIPEPVLLAKQVIDAVLKKEGFIFKGKILEGVTPPDASLIAKIESKPLSQLITHMLLESDNLYADSLFKEIAYAVTGDASYKQGAFAIKKVLTQKAKLDFQQIELADGAGGRYNLVTAEQVLRLLAVIYQDKNLRAIFFQALPEAGVSGSLKDRMKKTPLERKIFAKTGSMHDVSSLSGYMQNSQGKMIMFSILINGVNTNLSKAKSLEEKILLALADKN